MCRAISKALENEHLDYQAIEQLLQMSAEYNKCEPLCICCYHHLLEDVFRLPVKKCEEWERVKDICKMYPNNKVIVRIFSNHLTLCNCGIVEDLWDCTERLVDCYWIVPNKN